MIAAIAGDIIGSGFERSIFCGSSFSQARCCGYDVVEPRVDRTGERAKTFPLFVRKDKFTDDTVYIVAVMDWLMSGKDPAMLFRKYYRDYPDVGWGAFVKKWARSRRGSACGSFGNGAAMRAPAIGHYGKNLSVVLRLAEESSAVTHTVRHAIKGAQAIAMGVYLARMGERKDRILDRIEARFQYPLHVSLDSIRPFYAFTSLCSRTVPLAFRAFMEGENYEGVIRRAISVGGDSDTIASMAGALAGTYYGVPKLIKTKTLGRLPQKFRSIVTSFEAEYVGIAPALQDL